MSHGTAWRWGPLAGCSLAVAKFPGIPHVADVTQTANACTGRQCIDQRTEQDGSIICHYGRSRYRRAQHDRDLAHAGAHLPRLLIDAR